MNRRFVVIELLLMLAVAGCNGVSGDASGIEASIGLESATISGIYDDPIKLIDGRYEGAPFVPGGASRPTVMLLPENRVRADFDGDGDAEWLTLLAESSGGSGTFIYLAVLKEDGGDFHSISTVLLGDRLRIGRVSADGGRVQVELLEADAGGYSSCPPGLSALNWRWIDDRLEPVGPLCTSAGIVR